ncbi:hypothetical protein SAMN05216588_11216 [Pseudomonas flavescens]|uniref:Uncharacterized protein n=1 Tax=Phytopseudomonas flavescens TaxID=29435 RepID=A0A1G8IAW8_9GAMM|nr:hypothetical protein [Pseudomonas flavescens]SDI15710.1 hypothetical protein SAMN05216588_11216 [Pseudomonas flavescens]
MKTSLTAGLVALALVASAQACEVDTAAAARDPQFGNRVIPVRVAPGERCVIIDHLSAEGARTYRELWLRVEKMGPSKTRLGRLKRDYRLEGENPRLDRYVYVAGNQRGEDSLVFASFRDGQERRAVEYRISVE